MKLQETKGNGLIFPDRTLALYWKTKYIEKFMDVASIICIAS